jgi:hypothetical protein
VFDIDEFVAECEAAVAETQAALRVKELVERAVTQPDQIDDALGTANTGGFRCLHRSPAMTVRVASGRRAVPPRSSDVGCERDLRRW